MVDRLPHSYSKGTDETVSEAVVRAVAGAAGADVTELPPLAGTIDPDALDAPLSGVVSRARVSFAYHGYEISVEIDGSGTDVAVERER